MSRQASTPREQSGVALVALLVLLLLAASYAFYRQGNLGDQRLSQRETLLRQLNQAKDALITQAAINTTQPGRLLCPDQLGDGISPLLTRDDCDGWSVGGPDFYTGWLPWKTLDLTQGGDASGSNLNYVLTRWFGGNRTTPPLNSDTTTTLRLDVPAGNASNDIVAVIIAPRGPLDSRNADGDAYFYNGGSDTPDDNDVVVAVTRQELMTAVEQRVANELRACLEDHSTATGNPQRTYPWPAPLSNTLFKGVEGSLFGMLPETQPGNPELALQETISKLSILKNELILPSTVEQAKTQAATLSLLQQTAAYARALFDQLYTVALALNISARNASQAFSTLDATLVNATANKTIFSALAGTLPGAISDALPSLVNLQTALDNAGFDIFLTELQTQNATLGTALGIARATTTVTTLNNVLTSVNEFNNRLLNYASTPNPDIEALITSAFNASAVAAIDLNTAKKTLAPADITTALNEAQALYDSNQILAAAITSLHDIARSASDIAAAQATLAANDSTANRQTLASTLGAARSQTSSIGTGTIAMAQARTLALQALDDAITLANRQDSELTALQSAATQAASALGSLSVVLNDNVVVESLKTMAASLTAATQQVPTTVTAGKALRVPVKAVIYWSDTAAAQADTIATAARRGIINGVPAQADSASSAYTAASRLLDSLDGDTGSMTLLDRYIANPSTTTLSDATAALSGTQSALTAVLAAAQRIDGNLTAGMAGAAVPTVWYGGRCTPFAPPTGSATWWTSNGWKNLFFYQISDRIRPTTGQLLINGAGNYRHVVISAGRSIWSNASAPCDWKAQDRSLLPRTTAAYLEGGNAHTSRDGDAKTPVKTFAATALTAKSKSELDALLPGCIAPINYPTSEKYPIITFNDRLAY